MAIKSLNAMSERVEQLVQALANDEAYFMQYVSDVETLGMSAANYCLAEEVANRSGLCIESVYTLPSFIKLNTIRVEMEKRHAVK